MGVWVFCFWVFCGRRELHGKKIPRSRTNPITDSWALRIKNYFKDEESGGKCSIDSQQKSMDDDDD